VELSCGRMLSYVLVTPARDEAANLKRLAPCVVEQTIPPAAWIVVDDGSTDGTDRLVAELAREHAWIQGMASPAASEAASALRQGRRIGRDVIAFNAGVASLTAHPDVVVKLDADVSFDPDYFERLLGAFEADPTLGISGGDCYELEDGEWRYQTVTESHVRGATRAYRWACWEGVAPLEPRLGWDGIDEVKARQRGWSVATVSGLRFLHHRPHGAREGLAFTKWARMGEACHYMGYRTSYLVLRTAHRGRRDRGAIGLLWGYFQASVRRAPKYHDESVRRQLREDQALSKVLTRAWRGRGAARAS
jgi:poly-beta-1,6-N-acetyl-D-glucosamine synthase